jgi:hypothetical protein
VVGKSGKVSSARLSATAGWEIALHYAPESAIPSSAKSDTLIPVGGSIDPQYA